MAAWCVVDPQSVLLGWALACMLGSAACVEYSLLGYLHNRCLSVWLHQSLALNAMHWCCWIQCPRAYLMGSCVNYYARFGPLHAASTVCMHKLYIMLLYHIRRSGNACKAVALLKHALKLRALQYVAACNYMRAQLSCLLSCELFISIGAVLVLCSMSSALVPAWY